MKKHFPPKKALVVGIILFSLLCGVEVVISFFDFPTQVFYFVIWVLLYGYCTFLVTCQRNISLNAALVVRFIIASSVFAVIMGLRP